jgi:hypothetical protein
MKQGVRIVQKYLVVGHTQMEVDSMHASIEKKIVSDIFVPHDYIVIMEAAQIHPAPYVAKQLSHEEQGRMLGGC